VLPSPQSTAQGGGPPGCLRGWQAATIGDAERPLSGRAVERRRFPVGESPTRQLLQPDATGATVEVTKRLKPSVKLSRNTVTARVCGP